MSTVSFGGADAIDVGKSLESALNALQQLVEALAEDEKQLDFALNGNLDVKNIRAKSIEADRMNVQELSAIAANLGHITAGLIEAVKIVGSTIIGSYIATAENTYPRIEFSSSGNLLKALSDANNYISILPNSGGQPLLEFKTGSTADALFFSVPGTFAMNTLVGNMSLNSQAGDLALGANNILKLTGASLTMDGFAGYSGSFSVITGVNFTSSTTTSKTVTVRKGIVTSVS